MSFKIRCARTVTACCRTPASGSCKLFPHALSPYRCSVHGSTALGNRNARSPSATMSAARASRSLSPRARVKMSARCASQNSASIAMRRESAASAAPRSNAWPAATAGCPHNATTTGAYAATRPLPATADFLDCDTEKDKSSASHASRALSRDASSATEP
eukprot:31346-Pelagococcus_subviridis.AAC.16